MSLGPTHATAEVAPAEAAPVAEPAPVSPLAPVPMMVGHAEDRAEHEADAMADSALERLRGLEGDPHQHGPGCDHGTVQRSAAPPSGASVVGYEGGALDAGTTDAIESRRGSGRPLDADVRRRMESAFSRDFSSVRIHDDAHAAKLSSAISASAFTTGKDIFFGRRQYDPGSPGGERMLAHELAHTLQPAGGAHRLVQRPVGSAFVVRRDTVAPVEAAPAPAHAVPANAAAQRPPQLAGQMNMNPKTLDELLQCNNVNIRFLAQQTSPRGPLRDILVGAFEADWFRAKSCLVFDKWPGDAVPRFTHEFSLMLMTALTAFRGEVHKAVMPLAQKAVRKQLDDRAQQLQGNAALADSLRQQRMIPGVKQIDFKGSVGADTVTSDVDVSTGGANSELGVRAYNEAFREYMDLTFDPGTVFDLNVYAMDFIHGKVDNRAENSFTVKSENPEKPEADDAAARDREQDIWALVHVARYMPDDGEWDDYVLETLSGISDPKQRSEQKARLDAARSRAKGFEERLVGMMVHLEDDLMLTEKQLKGSSWDAEENQHYLQGALRMRAANKLYEDKLLQVKELRTQIAELRAAINQGKEGADPERLKLLVSRLSGELSMAQLYANEVYGSGGATVHAVMGMQVKKKLSAEWKHDVQAIIPVQEWYQAFTDNLGDVLKDYEHYGQGHGGHEADHWYAAFKMGKYADRMVDAIPHLAEGGMITQPHLATLLKDADLQALKVLSENHVKEKSGPSKDDPAKLKNHEYFGKMTAETLKDLRRAALTIGAKVRQMVATDEAAPIVDPSSAPAPETPEKAPASISEKSGAALVLAAQAARAQDLLEELEDESEDMEP